MNCFKSLARSSFTPHGSVSRVCRQSILGKGFRNTFSSALRAKQPLQELRSTSPPETNSHNSTRCNKGALSQSRANLAIVFGAATLAAALTLIPRRKTTVAEEAHDAPDHFRLEEIRKHNRHAEYHWVYRGTRVYDITDFVEGHPGGEVILRAAGGSIDPYWDIFNIHHKQDVYDILEEYFIGEIDPRDLVDGKAPTDEIEDPFQFDPERSPDLVVLTERPFNAETPLSDLQSFLTPTEKFFTRHHMWVPPMEELQEQEFRLVVELPDGTESAYSLADLRSKFKEHTITATLQCSGNRRAHMNAESSEDTSGLPWDVGGISNATWTGVRMVDVLQDAGFEGPDSLGDVRHVQFTGAEAYGASVPIEKVLDRFGDVLIAYSMNGKPLPRDHGFPLRALVPGTVAARSVKWLNRISLSSEESSSQWQRRDYKCFGPNERKNPDWDSAPAIQETPVQSAITSMQHIKGKSEKSEKKDSDDASDKSDESDNEDCVLLQGYAYSGGGRRIIRVDVSPDDGKTWQQAELAQEDEKGQKSWSWRRWSRSVPSKLLNGNVCVKAIDDTYSTQPESFEAHWNLRGNLATSWHKIPVAIVKEKAAAARSRSK